MDKQNHLLNLMSITSRLLTSNSSQKLTNEVLMSALQYHAKYTNINLCALKLSRTLLHAMDSRKDDVYIISAIASDLNDIYDFEDEITAAHLDEFVYLYVNIIFTLAQMNAVRQDDFELAQFYQHKLNYFRAKMEDTFSSVVIDSVVDVFLDKYLLPNEAL